MKNILVVGGAGFIGSHLVDSLLKDNYFVVVLDNLMRGIVKNISHNLSNPNFKFIEGDASKLDIVEKIIEENNIDTIYHLAANSDIQESANNPQIEYDSTFTTTWTILTAMRNKKVKNLFFSSTSAVYGDQKGLLSEDKTLLNPISYYGSCKMASEAIIKAFSFMNDFNCLIFRFPNVIGPRVTHGVIYDFVSKLKANPNELNVLGNGSQSKPYIYVFDLIEAIRLFDNKFPHIFDIYNIGLDSHSTVKDIANIVVDVMGLTNRCQIKYGEGNTGWKGDVPRFDYDLTKIHNLGWHNKYESNESVRLTAESIKN